MLEKIKKDLKNRSETKIENIKILIEKFNKLKITKNEEVEEAKELAENGWDELKNKIIYRMEELSVEIYEDYRNEIIKEIYKYSDLQSEKEKKINSLKIFYKNSKSQLETEKEELKKYILTIEEKQNLENVMKAEENFTEIISKAQKIVNIKPTRKQKEGKEEENKEETKHEKKKESLMKIVRTKSVDSLATMAKEIKNTTKNKAELEIEELLKNCGNLEKKWDEIKNIGTSIDLFNEKIFDLEDEIKGIINEIEADKYVKEGGEKIIIEENKGEKQLNKEELKEKQLEEFKKKFKKLRIFNENKVELEDEYTELEEKFLADKSRILSIN
ncbi:unnamed protein product [Meloidogyne enterolobii]|uniref:Uncharacterized protein n=1 Tax=Meloidogyne enterolobii TaxID=390850 RepID=A0ACB0ZVY6_MELEN